METFTAKTVEDSDLQFVSPKKSKMEGGIAVKIEFLIGVPCPRCGGTGKYFGVMCSLCIGTGRV